MNFQKTFIFTTKIINLAFGLFLAAMSIAAIIDRLIGSNQFTRHMLKDTEQAPVLGILLFGYLSYSFIHDFFYFRRKMMVGLNDLGICVYSSITKSYLFIMWEDLDYTSVSYGFGGNLRVYPEGLIIFNFKKVSSLKVINNSTYINAQGICDLNIISSQEIGEGCCEVDFGYWSWQPYVINKEIRKRTQLQGHSSHL